MQAGTIIGGFGGQGILFAGQVLAQAGLDEDRAVSWLPSYGPEMRGGTASCTVIVSDEIIGSPILDTADVVIAMNPPSLSKYEPLVAPGGLLVLNASLIEAEPTRTDIEVVRVPCAAIAREVGDDRVLSVAALGAAIARRPQVQVGSVRTALKTMAGKAGAETVAANLRALELGMVAAKETVSAAAQPGAEEETAR